MSAVTAATRARIFGPLVNYPNGAKGTDPNNLVTVTTPWGIKVRLHFLIVDRFLAACERAHRTVKWTPLRIDSFNPRLIRGSATEISLHALGLAGDFFATPPDVVPPGGVWTPDDEMPPEFVRCFTDLGFRWGGTFKRRDTPHIEWADGKPAPLTDPPPAPIEEEDEDVAPRIVYLKDPRSVNPAAYVDRNGRLKYIPTLEALATAKFLYPEGNRDTDPVDAILQSLAEIVDGPCQNVG